MSTTDTPIDKLEEVITGTDVRGVIAGHLHYTTISTFGGVPLSVAAATCYSQDLFAEDGSMRGVNGGRSFNTINVYNDRVVHNAIPLEESPTLYEMSAERLRRYTEMTPEERLAAASAHQD